jgi:DNA-binding MarR family transcriptional regulator
MDQNQDQIRNLFLLEEIEKDPDTTQASLAQRLGVAVGTVNWYLKRLISKGYVKVKQAERRKLRYIITPEGIALRAKLTVAYVDNSMTLYRNTRQRAKTLLSAAITDGYDSVQIQGDGDLAEVCRLTCLELGMTVLMDDCSSPCALLEIDGKELRLRYLEPETVAEGMSTTSLKVDSMDQRI